MKKLLKIILYLIGTIVFLYLVLVVISQSFFIKKYNLSCKGIWTIEYVEDKKPKFYKEEGLESLIISITEFPLIKPFVQINQGNRYLVSDSSITKDIVITSNQEIYGGIRTELGEGDFSYYGMTFNRITKKISIEETQLGLKEHKQFTGVCGEIKPL